MDYKTYYPDILQKYLFARSPYLRVDLFSGSFTDPIVTQHGGGGNISNSVISFE